MYRFNSIDIYNKLLIPYMGHIQYLHCILLFFCVISSQSFLKVVDLVYKRCKRRSRQMEYQTAPECSICYEKILKTNTAITKCNHLFHLECITKWALKNNTCPLCRFRLLNNSQSVPPPSIPQHRLLQDYDQIMFIRNAIRNRLNNINNHIAFAAAPAPPAPAAAPAPAPAEPNTIQW